MPLQPARLDGLNKLEAYFTGLDHLQRYFQRAIDAETLQQRLLVIHGVGGVGKSSLLRMFRLHCERKGASVGLSSGDEARSALAVLSNWSDDLSANYVTLSAFSRTLRRYQQIQAKVREEALKAESTHRKAASTASDVMSKTGETVASGVASTALNTVVPGLGLIAGVIAGVIGGKSPQALLGWLSSFLPKPEIDLLLDPVERLTKDFLDDIDRLARSRRIVLMLDTFEQITALEDWVRNFAQNLHENVLLVIGGRDLPKWDRHWPTWMAEAHVEELLPMTKETMRDLVKRYYRTIRGGVPDPVQVEAIISFGRGLPLVVTSAVQLWVQYGVEDFQLVKPQVVADLVDRLLEGVPKPLVPVLEVAAIVRWFNKDVLRAMSGLPDINAVYDELRRFPFTRPRSQGLTLHDAVREIIAENLLVHDPRQFRALHDRAATYFEQQVPHVGKPDADRYGLERLYHRLKADETQGIKLFQEQAEDLVRFRFAKQLRALLKDVYSYGLQDTNSKLWLQYFNARLADLEGRLDEAERVYKAIGENNDAESKVQAYALCDWLGFLIRPERIQDREGREKARAVSKKILSDLEQPIDAKLVWTHVALGSFYTYLSQYEQAIESLFDALRYFEEQGDRIGQARIWSAMKVPYGGLGDWPKVFDVYNKALNVLPKNLRGSAIRGELLPGLPFIWAGRYIEVERDIRQAVQAELNEGFHDIHGKYADLGCAIGMQGRFGEAYNFFEKAVEIQRNYSFRLSQSLALIMWGTILLKEGDVQKAEEKLRESFRIRQEMRDDHGLPDVLVWLGQLEEVRHHWPGAEAYYHKSLDYRRTGRRYYESGALTGLIRVKHEQRDYATIPPLLAEAEQFAQQYQYNDQLASMRLSQGHIAWDTYLPNWGQGFDVTSHFYQQALVYALRYNRFLLDEVLWGGGVATPLRPIIPHCLSRGEEGRRMLFGLYRWWKKGINDIGTPRPDTISPIPVGISLLEAERLSREREPGDGSPQLTVLEQIERAVA